MMQRIKQWSLSSLLCVGLMGAFFTPLCAGTLSLPSNGTLRLPDDYGKNNGINGSELARPVPPIKGASFLFKDAFVRAVPPDMHSTSVYLTITNNTDHLEKLVGASSKVAEHVELHRIMNDHGLRRMHEIDEIVLPPHSAVALKFGTYHLMLVGLKQPVVAGAKIPVVLRFANAGEVKLLIPVVEVKAKNP